MKLGACTGFAHDVADEGGAPGIIFLPRGAGEIGIRDGPVHADAPVLAHQGPPGRACFRKVRVVPIVIFPLGNSDNRGAEGGNVFAALTNPLVPLPGFPRPLAIATEPESPARIWVTHRLQYEQKRPFIARQ